MSEQWYARIAPHSAVERQIVGGKEFKRPPNPMDLTSFWEPVDVELLAVLKQKRHGKGPSAPPIFEYLQKSDLERQIATARKSSGTNVQGIDLSVEAQILNQKEIQRQLEEQKALNDAQAKQHASEIGKLTALVEKLIANQGASVGAPTPQPTMASGATGDIADPKVSPAQDAKPAATPKGKKDKDAPQAPDARPADAPKPFVSTNQPNE